MKILDELINQMGEGTLTPDVSGGHNLIVNSIIVEQAEEIQTKLEEIEEIVNKCIEDDVFNVSVFESIKEKLQ